MRRTTGRRLVARGRGREAEPGRAREGRAPRGLASGGGRLEAEPLLAVRRAGLRRADRGRPVQPDRQRRRRHPRRAGSGRGLAARRVRRSRRARLQRRRRQRLPGRLRELAQPVPRGPAARTRPARSRPAEAIRVCDLFDQPLAISFWFTRGGDCIPRQNAFDEVACRYDGSRQLPHPSTSATIARRSPTSSRSDGWKVPVGLDPDGAVSNLYRVGGCPTIVLAYPGGILYDARTRGYEPEEIDGFVDELLTASREPRGALAMSEPARRGRPRRRRPPGSATSSRACTCATCSSSAARAAAPRAQAAAARSSPTASPAPQAISDALAADPVGLPRLLPPHRARPRRDSRPRSRS